MYIFGESLEVSLPVYPPNWKGITWNDWLMATKPLYASEEILPKLRAAWKAGEDPQDWAA